jgi:hypothetical protein
VAGKRINGLAPEVAARLAELVAANRAERMTTEPAAEKAVSFEKPISERSEQNAMPAPVGWQSLGPAPGEDAQT